MTNLAEMSLSKASLEMLEILIESGDDEFEFIHNFLNKYHGNMLSAQEFRLYKIAQRNLTFDYFEREYMIDKRSALQKLFLFPMDNGDVKLLERKINNRYITLSELYNLHRENPELKMTLLIK